MLGFGVVFSSEFSLFFLQSIGIVVVSWTESRHFQSDPDVDKAMSDNHQSWNGEIGEIAATSAMRTVRQVFGEFRDGRKLISPLRSRCEVVANLSETDGEVTISMDGLTSVPFVDRIFCEPIP